VLASWERAGRGLPCHRWTPEIREVALRGSPAEGDVYGRVAAQRANGIWEDAWDLHVWAQRLPPQHYLRDPARVALWALKGSNPPVEAWPPLDLDWAAVVEAGGKTVTPPSVAAARVGALLLEVWLALAEGVPVLEYGRLHEAGVSPTANESVARGTGGSGGAVGGGYHSARVE
jgi:hypothetical protein